MSKKALWLKYGISGATCLALALARIFSYDFSLLNNAQRYMVLSDAFFIPGIFCVLIGLMFWASASGALDGIGYAMHYVICRPIPGKSDSIGTYGDYLEEHQEKRPKGYGFLLIVGSACMVLCVVFFALYSGEVQI